MSTKLQKKTSPAGARAIAALHARAVPLILSVALLAAPGCMNWRPLGSNNITFDQEHLAGQPLRITTYSGKVTEMTVVHVKAPFVLVETDEVDGKKWLEPVYLHPSYKVEVKVPDRKMNKVACGVAGGSAVLVAIVIAAAVSLSGRSLLNLRGIAGR